MAKIKLIVGLGNPGKQYESTRHNAGYWFVDHLSDKFAANLQRKDKFFGYIATVNIEGNSVYLLKPDTFMNLSGKSVQALASFYRIDTSEILVAHDELDIGAGEIRLKTGGGHGGHNGLRDIIGCLGQRNFYRLRIGIGHPGHASQVTSYVLNNPPSEDRQQIENSIDKAAEQIDKIVIGQFESAMQVLHTREKN